MSEQGDAVRSSGTARRGFPSRGAGLVVAAALFGLTIGAAVRSFAWYPLRITSNSMLPTVAAGDWVVVARNRTGTDVPIDRGDIILFRFPFGGDGRAIKRVVAVAGDEVRTAGPDVVLVNGNVNGNVASRGPSQPGAEGAGAQSADAALRIPEGYVYILGDNVRSSIDSRSLGLLPRAEVLGKVAAVLRRPW